MNNIVFLTEKTSTRYKQDRPFSFRLFTALQLTIGKFIGKFIALMFKGMKFLCPQVLNLYWDLTMTPLVKN